MANASQPAWWGHAKIPLFYYTHLAKTGGSSFVEDAPRFAGLIKCGDVHCGGDPKVNLPDTVLPKMGRQWERRRSCNFMACEGKLKPNIKRVSGGSEEAGNVLARDPRSHLHMLREPHSHILSMYGHCQTRTAGVLAAYVPVSFHRWLGLAAKFAQTGSRKDGDAMGKHCSYNPANFQTRKLGADLQAAEREVREAAYVGLLEHYQLSLCLLATVVDGAAPPECGCVAAASNEVPLVRGRALKLCSQYACGPVAECLHHGRSTRQTSTTSRTPRQ